MIIDSVWVIYRSESDLAKEEAKLLYSQCKNLGIEVYINSSGKEKNPFTNLLNKKKKPSLVIILGGDGTVLNAARHLCTAKIPILSFNVGGNLGFLTHEKKMLKTISIMDRLINNCFIIEKRMMLEACIKSDSRNQKEENIKNYYALNDFYFRPHFDEVAPTCILRLEIDNEIVNTYKGDGLIISTPTGSTAYSMASGGPILHCLVPAILVSPICSMSLSSRPIVIPSHSILKVKPISKYSNLKVNLWQDGERCILINQNDTCIIKKSNYYSQMIILEERPSYYKTLSQKLYWTGNLTNKD